MKKLPGILMLCLILSVAGEYAGAQNFKFGYINKDQLFKAIPDYDSANVKIERFRMELVTQLGTMQGELNDKTAALNKEITNIPDVVRKTKDQELKDLNIRLQLFQAKASQLLSDKNTELIQPIITKVDKAIKDVSKEQGFTFVFDAAVLYYFDEKKSTDMLPLVKTKLGLK